MLYPSNGSGKQFRRTLYRRVEIAGWDGVVVDGASSDPVWINIVDDKVTIESAKGIWGMDTRDAQRRFPGVSCRICLRGMGGAGREPL